VGHALVNQAGFFGAGNDFDGKAQDVAAAFQKLFTVFGFTQGLGGYGAHLCLGQHLAKMEMRILFEELLPRLESLEFNGQPRRSLASFVSGPKSLPIRYRMT
jgi:cytochrome P450